MFHWALEFFEDFVCQFDDALEFSALFWVLFFVLWVCFGLFFGFCLFVSLVVIFSSLGTCI